MGPKELVLDHRFDKNTTRHYLNDDLVVLHCHHYMSLYLQLAEDVDFLDGKALLADVTEEVFYDTLKRYYTKHGIRELADRVSIAEQYFAALGMGKMNVLYAGDDSGEVELTHSHVDEGWIKKWGMRSSPINYFACGYIAAMFDLFNDKPLGYSKVEELESIVTGAKRSLFRVAVK